MPQHRSRSGRHPAWIGQTRLALAALPLLLLAVTAPASADIAAAEAALAARDYERAAAALQPLADGGDSYAQWRLAELYLGGHGGSPEAGLALLQQAATTGEPEAQGRLGVLYAKGDGVTQDNVEAYKWLALAARGAPPGRSRTLAETNLEVVSARMSATQRAEAETATRAASAAMLAPEPVTAPAPEPLPEPEPAAAEPAPMPTTPLADSYRIQLASVPNEGDVAGEWARLKKQIGAPIDALELHVEAADLGAQGTYHRLQAGPFASKEEATAACSAVKAGGDDCLVVGP